MWHVTLFHRCVKIISLLFFEVLYFSDFLLCILPVCCFVCICLWLYLTDKAFCHDIVNVCASGFPTPRSHHPDPVTPQEETLEPFSVPGSFRKMSSEEHGLWTLYSLHNLITWGRILCFCLLLGNFEFESCRDQKLSGQNLSLSRVGGVRGDRFSPVESAPVHSVGRDLLRPSDAHRSFSQGAKHTENYRNQTLTQLGKQWF